MNTRFRHAGVVVLLGSAAWASSQLWAQQALATKEIHSQATEREAVALTVYNDNLALVKERRKVDFAAGSNRLALREVAARMRPETALLRAVNGPALNL